MSWNAAWYSGPFNKAGLKAEKQVAKDLDVNPKDIDQAVQEAASED